MPEMNGFELCRQLKLDKTLNHIPLIFYTATYTDARDEELAMSLGASRFVLKPTEPEKLLAIIDDVIQESLDGHLPTPTKLQKPRQTIDELYSDSLSRKLQKKIDELEVQKRQIQLLTNALPVLIAEIDQEGRLRYVNQTYTQWYQRPYNYLIGQLLQDTLDEASYAVMMPYITQALAGERVTYEALLSFADGKERSISAQYIPYVDDKEQWCGFFALISDITQHKHHEQELKLHREQLETLVTQRTKQLEASKNDLEAFCYSVSHDLRAPLRAVSGFSEALAEDYGEMLDDVGHDYLRRIVNGTRQMTTLIHDLLSLYRISRNDMDTQIVDVSQIAHDVADDIQNNDSHKQIHFTIQNGISINADHGLLRIVLQNLFDNACKFHTGKNPIEIHFGSQIQNGQTILFVQDNGIGFEMAMATKIFTAFHRLHSQEEYPGTGIGLASVQRIIERHHGKIWAESVPGEGATFYFVLNLPSELLSQEA